LVRAGATDLDEGKRTRKKTGSAKKSDTAYTKKSGGAGKKIKKGRTIKGGKHQWRRKPRTAYVVGKSRGSDTGGGEAHAKVKFFSL